jgi:hypothetical protein
MSLMVVSFVKGADVESPRKCTPSSCKKTRAVILALKSLFAYFINTHVVDNGLMVGGRLLSSTGIQTEF